MADTARERATEQMHRALTHDGHVVPRSMAAAIINEAIEAAVAESADEVTRILEDVAKRQAIAGDSAIAQLSNARLAHDEQIGKLLRIADLQNVGQFAEAEAVIDELKGSRDG